MIKQVTVPPGEKGDWRISNFVIDEKKSDLSVLSFLSNRRGLLPPGVYTQLTCEGRGLVMSDTPDEMRDHIEFVIKAKGHVLINGLGLGMVLAAVLAKPSVERVTVIELEQDVIDLAGPHYACERLEIVCCSAFDYRPPKGVRYGAVWHDIWDHLHEDNLPEMTMLQRKYGRRCDWQGSWGRDYIEIMMRGRRRYF